ncbi:MAG: toprim domain-containing protein [Deltaproteobacteria bacterium]|nr:toprim domain-containing protein [Deltaproteobacteria bacterium]
MTILDIASSCGVTPKRNGTSRGEVEFSSACPMCGGDDRFCIWPEKNTSIGRGTFYCRGCEARGDSVTLLGLTKGMDFKAACEYLNHKLVSRKGTQRTVQNKPAPLAHRVCVEPPELWQKRASLFIEGSKILLQKNGRVVDWLNDKRGIDELTAWEFGLGWNPKDFFLKRRDWGLVHGKDDKDLYLPSGLIIPCIKNEQVVRIRFRKAKLRDKNDARYIILAGGAMTPMVIAQKNERIEAVIIVESELDAILIAQEAGDIVTVIAMGNAQARPDEASVKILKASPYILVALDFDTAGAKVWARWQAEYQTAVRWPTPQGKDPTDYFEKHGGNIREWVIAGLPPAFKPAA